MVDVWVLRDFVYRQAVVDCVAYGLPLNDQWSCCADLFVVEIYQSSRSCRPVNFKNTDSRSEFAICND